MTNPASNYAIVPTQQRHATSLNLTHAVQTSHMKTRLLTYSLLTFVFGCLVTVQDEYLTLIAKHAQNGWQGVVLFISDIGKGENFLVPTFSICVIGYIFRKIAIEAEWKLWFQTIVAQAAFVFGAVALSGALANILKLLIGRTRPKLLEWYGAFNFAPFSWEHTFQSMPSGHACTIGAVTCALCIWLPKRRWLILPLGFLLASTRYFGLAHYFSDVIFGFGLGYIFTLYFALWLQSRDAGFRFANGRLTPTHQILCLDRIFR